MLVVVTADQRGSRRGADRVPDVLTTLNTVRRRSPHRSFERTAGDEVQGVLSDPADVVDVVGRLVRSTGWRLGVGVGDVELPLARSTRAARGPAFVHARQAVERARTNPGRLAVAADDAPGALRLETVLMLWADVLERRTPGGWEVVDLLADGLTHEQVAARIGVTQSADSQRAATAGVVVSARAATLAADLLGGLLASDVGDDR